MPRYMVERDFGDVADDDLLALTTQSKRLLADDYPQIVWEHSHVCAADDGRVLSYCVYDAPSEGDVRAHAGALGSHEIRSIHEIVGDVTPESLPG